MALLISPDSGRMACDLHHLMHCDDAELLMLAQFAEPGRHALPVIRAIQMRGLWGELLRVRALEPAPGSAADR